MHLFYRDSSISERDRLKAAVQRKMRNEKIAALKAERTTSRVMARFRSAFGGPSASKQYVNNSAALDRNPTSLNYASQSSESDSDEETTQRKSLLRRPRDVNRSNIRCKVPIYPTYDQGRYPIARLQARNALASYDSDQSGPEYVVYWDYESTCSSSCDSDDLDYSYQYETRCFDPVCAQNERRRDNLLPKKRWDYDFVSYDIYSSSDSNQDVESAEENEHMTEPVSLVIGRT